MFVSIPVGTLGEKPSLDSLNPNQYGHTARNSMLQTQLHVLAGVDTSRKSGHDYA